LLSPSRDLHSFPTRRSSDLQDGAIADYRADDAFPISDIDDILPGLIEGRERVYYSVGNNPEFDQQMMEWLNSIRSKARMGAQPRSEEHTSELQSRFDLVCRL